MKTKVMCYKCGNIEEVEDSTDSFFCEKCSTTSTVQQAKNSYQLYLGKLFKSANQAYEEAFSFKQSCDYFSQILELEPDNLDAYIGVINSKIRMSTLIDTNFKEVYNSLKDKNLLLDETTYIRLGHFIEQIYTSLFVYINKAYKIYKESKNLVEQAAVLKSFFEIKQLFGLLKDNLAAFNDDEKKESFYVTDEEITSFESTLNQVLSDKNIVIVNDKAQIYINGKLMDVNDINKETFSSIEDKVLFLSNPSNVFFKIIFAILGVSCAGMLVGFILILLNMSTIGLSIAGSFLGVFIVTYLVFKKRRQDYLAEANKY